MESLLQKTIAWKFKTQAEYRMTTEKLVYTAMERIADMLEPIIDPIDRGLDRLLEWYNAK